MVWLLLKRQKARVIIYGGLGIVAVLCLGQINQVQNQSLAAEARESILKEDYGRISEVTKGYQRLAGKLVKSSKQGVDTGKVRARRNQIRIMVLNRRLDDAWESIKRADLELEELLRQKAEEERLDLEARQQLEAEAGQQGTLIGTVTNSVSGSNQCLIGIYSSADKVLEAVSGADGTYQLSAKLGVYAVRVTCPNAPVAVRNNIELRGGETVALDIAVNPRPVVLARSPQASLSSKYERRMVETSRGSFMTDIMTFDLSSGRIRVVTDTANDTECSDDCNVKSLQEFVAENGGFAGINGTYFCPADYAVCEPETNYFFWKMYNSELGRIINNDNGLGEYDHFLAFDVSGRPRYFPTWKDFTVSGFPAYAGLNSKPALIYNGRIVLDENSLDDKQRNAKIRWGAIGLKGEMLYVVVGHSVTIPDLAAVVSSLGLDHAMAIDGGGTTALIYRGAYKLGPGRRMPNAILFAERR